MKYKTEGSSFIQRKNPEGSSFVQRMKPLGNKCSLRNTTLSGALTSIWVPPGNVFLTYCKSDNPGYVQDGMNIRAYFDTALRRWEIYEFEDEDRLKVVPADSHVTRVTRK